MISTRRTRGKVVQATVRNIEEQLLYHKGADGKFDITITDYWDRVVCRVLPAYSHHKFSSGNRRVVCPFHDDIAPSLGLVTDKETGVEIFNCFGCGAHGTVTHFHRLFFSKYRGLKSKNALDYLVSLAKVYGVSLRTEVLEEETRQPLVDFSKEPPYSVRIHKENVQTLRSAFKSGSLSISELASSIDALTQRVLKAKSG